MRITVLTSSRADFGIQLPLLNALRADPFFRLHVIAFGSHADQRFGHTLDEVVASGFAPTLVLPPVLVSDDAAGITLAMAKTMEQFSAVWRDHGTDLIVALGDRYEMFAAVAAALPFGIPVAHLHGGETTLGAMDNALRHSITHMSALHFTGAEAYRQRVHQLTGSDDNVYNTGALSIDNLCSMQLLPVDAIKDRFGCDLSHPTVLITYHPETAGSTDEEADWSNFSSALSTIAERYRLLVTLPNADTHGLRLRERWKVLLSGIPSATSVDSLGALGYLSCMRYCAFVLGNSSSGYVEASFFPKHVIDLGERQTGRIVTPNIQRCRMDTDAILAAVKVIEAGPPANVQGTYGDGQAAQRMVGLLKQFPLPSLRKG
ncbi:MAG: UDP-N-acetylglucosamine 2-epimerase (hydrolyzing) [Flavobacteriales bacterium]|nr:UDP-N-acetylglucosamine 2-epimerase (hydrolyzing) [Flavobacteriales bacterium]